MTSEAQDNTARRAQEAAYRRGWQHGSVEATLLVLQLMELGYERRKIRQLLAMYNDLCVSAWRTEGDLEQMEPFPAFDIERLEAIAATRPGYAWLLHEP